MWPDFNIDWKMQASQSPRWQTATHRVEKEGVDFGTLTAYSKSSRSRSGPPAAVTRSVILCSFSQSMSWV